MNNHIQLSDSQCMKKAIKINKMHEQSHTIVRLAVHEEGYQNVYFQPGKEEAALRNSETKHTTLTAWFELNKVDDSARKYLYGEIPLHYRFDGKKWLKRKQRGTIIGRIYGVAPNDVNRFYIRILLLHVKGATFYEDLRTFADVTHNTFKEAVIFRGLIEDDAEWRNCLEGVSNVKMPKQLREMFAYICCFCEPKSPFDSWSQFKDFLTEDFKGNENWIKENKALIQINEILNANGFSCEQIGLPSPTAEISDGCEAFNAETEAAHGEEMLKLVNEEQRIIISRIMDATSGTSQENLFFLAAPGGCGKTFLYNCLLHIVRGKKKVALAGAFTGIAALLLPGGTTLHKLFGLPVPLTKSSVSNIKPNSKKAEILRETKIIVIDESSMIPASAVDCIDRLLRDVMKILDTSLNKRPMGGKILVFGGDFRQVLPVVPKGGKVQIIESCFQSCKLWPLFIKLRLTTNMRANVEEAEFSKWLLEIGNGESNHEKGVDFISLPQKFMCREDSIIPYVFGDSLSESNIDQYLSRAIVTPKNEHCFEINEKIINMMEGEKIEYVSVDAIVSDNPAEELNIPLEYLNSITPSGMPPHKLSLKNGAIVMLIRNMNIGSGLVNGVRMLVRGMYERCLKLEIITGIGKGNIIFIPRIKLISNDPNMPFCMTRLQFPIRVLFAITITKSQGQTFDKIGIYLPKPVFAHGQMYVAFSRVRSSLDVMVSLDENENQGFDKHGGFTKNIVYRELLF